MLRKLAAIVCLLALTGNALAGSSWWPGGWYAGDSHYGPGFYKAGFYSYPTYVEPVFVRFRVVIPLVDVPSYGAHYQPGPPAVAPAATTAPAAATAPSELKQILDAIKGMDARLKALEARPTAAVKPNPFEPAPAAATPPQAVALPDALAVLNLKCAACHLKGRESDGGGLVLLLDDKTRASLTAKQVRAFTAKVTTGKMPPARNDKGVTPCDDAQVTALLADLPSFPEAK